MPSLTGTFVRGRRVTWEDDVLGVASGEPVRFS